MTDLYYKLAYIGYLHSNHSLKLKVWEFIDFATAQGSHNATFYLLSVPKKAWSTALDIPYNDVNCLDGLEGLSTEDILNLSDTMKRFEFVIDEGMRSRLPYKAIYKLLESSSPFIDLI